VPTADWCGVLNEDQLGDDDMAAVSVDGVPVLVARRRGSLYAWADRCPHKESRLSDGDFDDGVLVCARHLWQFDIETGDSLEPPGHPLTAHRVRLRDGRIEIAHGAAQAEPRPVG
jgi:toluene monooxygenase system ferredoxin subunit